MRPLGVSIIAALTWFMGAIWAMAGLSVIGLTHLGGRLLMRVSDVSLQQRLTSGLGTSIGVVLLLTALVCRVVGIGLWNLKKLGSHTDSRLRRSGSVDRTPRSVIRSAMDAGILIYLMMPNVSPVFAKSKPSPFP